MRQSPRRNLRRQILRRRVVGGEEFALCKQLVLEPADRMLRRPDRSAPAFKKDLEQMGAAVNKDIAIAVLVTTAKLQ